MNMDMSQYLDVFLEESKEHLVNLNERLLELEKNPQDLSSLNEIFRAAHTLKGMSSTMGFNDMADLTHHMEDVLSDLKEGFIKVEGAVIDILFDCFDRLQIMVGNIQNSQPAVNNADLIEMLSKVKQGTVITSVPTPRTSTEVLGSSPVQVQTGPDRSGSVPFEFNQYDLTVLKEVQTRGLKPYYVSIKVAPDCLMKSVRVFMVFKSLEADGEIIKTCPPAQDLDEGRFDDQFHIVLVSQLDEHTIRQRIAAISEVETDILRLIELEDFGDGSCEAAGEKIPAVSELSEMATVQDKSP